MWFHIHCSHLVHQQSLHIIMVKNTCFSDQIGFYFLHTCLVSLSIETPSSAQIYSFLPLSYFLPPFLPFISHFFSPFFHLPILTVFPSISLPPSFSFTFFHSFILPPFSSSLTPSLPLHHHAPSHPPCPLSYIFPN